jgi:hypothetical protein
VKNLDDIKAAYFKGHDKETIIERDEFVKNSKHREKVIAFWLKIFPKDSDIRIFIDPFLEKNYFKAIYKFTLLACFDLLFYICKPFVKLDQKFIFIVGMPHAGTTLVQRIFNSSKIVNGSNSELNTYFIPNGYMTDENSIDEDIIYSEKEKLQLKKRLVFRTMFLKSLFIKNAIVVNKNPINSINLNSIIKIFPNSKIVIVRRNIISTVSSLIYSLPNLGEVEDRKAKVEDRIDKFSHPRPKAFKSMLDDNYINQLFRQYESVYGYLDRFSSYHDTISMNFESLSENADEILNNVFDYCNIDYSSVSVEIKNIKLKELNLEVKEAYDKWNKK